MTAPTNGGAEGGRIWRYLRGLLFNDGGDQTLREQIEEVIGEADADAGHAGTTDREGHRTGRDLSAIEREMLRNMLHFGERTVDDVAVPRSAIIAVDETASFDEIVALFAEADHSRLPVFRGNLDNIVGMIHVKDVFAILSDAARPRPDSAGLMRQPLYVPQAMSALELLAEMQAQRIHLAIVLDEYGGTEGLVTIEDLMEEIVGNIEDEHDDAPEEMLVAIGDGVWDCDARVELEELAERIDPRFGERVGDVETLAGLAVALAGHVPQPGEQLVHPSGWQIAVCAGDERRVDRVRLHRPDDHPVIASP